MLEDLKTLKDINNYEESICEATETSKSYCVKIFCNNMKVLMIEDKLWLKI